MKPTTNSPLYLYKDKVWLINANEKYGIRTDILRALLDQIAAMVHHHRKVFVYRFDLRVSEYTDNNKIISDFNRRLFKRIKSHYKVKRIGYGWAREMENAKRQHYHYMLLLDGSKINEPHRIQGWINDIWDNLDGTVHLSAYHNIKRNDETSIQEATRHISYLAKPRGKGYRPIQTKDFNTSRLK